MKEAKPPLGRRLLFKNLPRDIPILRSTEESTILLTVSCLYRALSVAKDCPLWVILLSAALVFAQSMRLHVHELDHQGEGVRHGIFAEAPADHSHVNRVHSSADLSHDDHHEGQVVEFDVTPDVLLKVTNDILAAALLVTAFFWLSSIVFRGAPLRLPNHVRAPPSRYHLVQPTRAPPI